MFALLKYNSDNHKSNMKIEISTSADWSHRGVDFNAYFYKKKVNTIMAIDMWFDAVTKINHYDELLSELKSMEAGYGYTKATVLVNEISEDLSEVRLNSKVFPTIVIERVKKITSINNKNNYKQPPSLISISGKMGAGKDLTGLIFQIILNNPHLNNEGVKTFLKKDIGDSGDWKIKKFADKLKDIVCLLLGVSREQLEDREFKEKELGEEWDKWCMENHWIDTDTIEKEYYTTEEDAKWFRNSVKNKSYYAKTYKVKMTPRLLLQLLGTEAGRNLIHPSIWINALMSEYKPIIQSLLRSEELNKGVVGFGARRLGKSGFISSFIAHSATTKYGGKGITICKEWEDFQKFRFWALSNGYTNELTLDRINVNGNYEPSNCRFVTSSLQAFNKGSYHQGTSKFKGVNRYSDGRWQAQIQSKGIKKNLGYYQTEEEARKVYQREYDRINKELEEESFNLQRKCVYPNFIITDTRFKNELESVKSRGGITIRVNRDYALIGGSEDPKNQHESETALDNAEFDYEIDNNGTVEDLINKVRDIIDKINN